VFNNDLIAASTNQMWVNSHQDRQYELELEPINDVLKITLQMYEIGCRCVYENVTYETFELNRFISDIKEAPLINFGHLTKWERGHILTKTSVMGLRWVLRVNRVRYWGKAPLVLVR
jgi:hypothetical protein